jgi:hypothetical protein
MTIKNNRISSFFNTPVVILKLNSGEEIITFILDDENDDYLNIYAPLIISKAHQYDEENEKVQVQNLFIKWLNVPITNDVFLYRNQIMAFSQPNNDIIKFFKETIDSIENDENNDTTITHPTKVRNSLALFDEDIASMH